MALLLCAFLSAAPRSPVRVQHETKVNTPPEAVETLEPDETPYSDCPRAVEFVLKDQFKEPHAFTLPAPKVTVLVFGDRKCSDDATPWSDALWKRYKDRIQYEIGRASCRERVYHPV